MKALKFRVLIDSPREEEIFRDVVIDPQSNFELFFRAIMSSFEFSGQEMASFYVSNESWDKGHELSLMDMAVEEHDGEKPSVMEKAIVADFIESKDQKFILHYDFLKQWFFLVELQGEVETELELPYEALSFGEAPKEEDKEIDLDAELNLEDDFDEYGDDEAEEFGTFENIDDYDI